LNLCEILTLGYETTKSDLVENFILMTTKKILFFLSSLSLCFFIFANSGTVYAAALEFSKTQVSASLGEELDVDVTIDTQSKAVAGADAVILYNPQYIEVVSVDPGDVFADYPARFYDNTNGKIMVSGIVSSKHNLYRGRGVMARIRFRTKAMGASQITFQYTPGDTTDSNVASMSEPGDILTSVNSISLAVQGGSYTQQVTTSTEEEQTTQMINQSLTNWGNLMMKLGFSPSFVSGLEQSVLGKKQDAYGPITYSQSKTDPNQSQAQVQTTYKSTAVSSSARMYILITVLATVFAVALGAYLLIIHNRKNTPPAVIHKTWPEEEQ
jgi:hypothetical protein